MRFRSPPEQSPTRFCCDGPAEVESRQVDPRVHREVAQLDDVLAVGDFLEHAAIVVQGVAVLVDVGKLHAGPQFDLARVRLLLADDHAEERRLAGAVGPDHAHDAAAGQVERAFFHQVELVAVDRVGLRDVS